MVQSYQSSEELAAAIAGISDLTFQIPDPEDEEIPDLEFQQQLDTAWTVCERFDLQTDIWRGRILRAIRDREKRGGDGRGTGFLNWLKEREISKSQAYALIELANSADTLLDQGHLDPSTINHFSKRAFVETAKSSPEVQQLVTEAARSGDRITRREVRQLSDEWTAMSSDLLPDEVKEKAASGSVPTRYLAPLVRELEKLPESHLSAIQEEAATNPEVNTIRQLTSDARNLSKYLDSAAQVQVLRQSAVDMEMALEEALRVGCLNTASDMVKQAAALEQTVAKLYMTWKRLAGLADRLYVDTGVTTPHLRSLINCIERISGEVIEVQIGDRDEQTIRLRILTDDNSQDFGHTTLSEG
jgi:hypothetical protein